MDPWTIAAIIAVITGAYAQNEGRQDNIKRQVQIQRTHDREQDRIRDEKRADILANVDDYNPSAWADGVRQAQDQRTAAIESLQAENGPTDFRFAARLGDDALKQAATSTTAKKDNATAIAKLMGKTGGYQMFGDQMGRQHRTNNTKFGRFAAEDSWNEANRRRELASNNTGAKRQMYGQLAQAIGMAYLGSGAGGGSSTMTNTAANSTASNGLNWGQAVV